MTNEEKATLIEFYKNTPQLWDTNRKEYRDRDQRRASMERLSKEFDDKYTVKDLAETWHKLSTHFQRESVKQESSLKSGAGKEDVYESDWPFFSSLEFIKDKIEPDEGEKNPFKTEAGRRKRKFNGNCKNKSAGGPFIQAQRRQSNNQWRNELEKWL